MSGGMLWAALGGAASGYGEVLDARTKEAADSRKRVQSIEDSQNALRYQMKLKSQMAQEEEDRVAGVLNKIDERGAAIGNERGARELTQAGNSVPSSGEYANDAVTPEMIAEMPPAARAIYEKEMGLTDDSSLQIARDRVTASGDVGAPQSIRKGLLDSVKQEQLAEQKAKEENRRERKIEVDEKLGYERLDRADQRAEENRASADAREARRSEAQFERAQAALKNNQASVDQTQKLSVLKDVMARAEASKPARKDYRNDAKFETAMAEWANSDNGKMAQQASSRILSIFGDVSPLQGGSSRQAPSEVKTPWVGGAEKAEQIRIISGELDKARAQGDRETAAALEKELARMGAPTASPTQSPPKSAPVSDNGQYKTGETKVVSSGPHKGKTAVFDGKGWKLK